MEPPAEVVPIVAIAHDRVIGAQNKLPWKLSEDLKRFKATTMGHPILMGRKTFESIGRPLPGRANIVVTRQTHYRVPPGVLVAPTPEEALRAAAGLSARAFVIGGAQLYAATLPQATEILATFVYASYAGDAFFPPLDAGWHVASREDAQSPEGLRFSFVRLARGDRADDCAFCRVRAGAWKPQEPWDAGLARVLADLAGPSPP